MQRSGSTKHPYFHEFVRRVPDYLHRLFYLNLDENVECSHAIRILRSCPNLRVLLLKYLDITNCEEELGDALASSRVEELKLHRHTHPLLDKLATMRHLTNLTLGNDGADDDTATLACLSRFTNLTVLRLMFDLSNDEEIYRLGSLGQTAYSLTLYISHMHKASSL